MPIMENACFVETSFRSQRVLSHPHGLRADCAHGPWADWSLVCVHHCNDFRVCIIQMLRADSCYFVKIF